MATNEEDWARLGSLVRNRREELRKTQPKVQEEGGPSPALLRTIESGRARSISRSKRRDLERALEWRTGSIDDVLRGEEPAPASEPVQIPNVRQHPGEDGGSGGYEITRKMGSFDPMKLFGLALLSNRLSEAAADFVEGDGSPDKLVMLAHRTHDMTIGILAEVLQVDVEEARQTARKMGYLFEDLGGTPSA